jgi:hypothetical protein
VFNAVQYGVVASTGLIDWQLERWRASTDRDDRGGLPGVFTPLTGSGFVPSPIGASSSWTWRTWRAGAADQYPNPVPIAMWSTTTHKTLRGPRGIILARANDVITRS